MSDTPYSKREVDTMISEIHSDVKDIKEQTTKTNGRVTSLELGAAHREGQITIIRWSLVAIVAPVLVAYLIGTFVH